MKSKDKYKLATNILNLKVVDTIDFQDEPILTLEQDEVGAKYLSYILYYEGELERRAIIAVSDNRLGAVLSGDMSLYMAYNSPENKCVYICDYGMSAEPVNTYAMPSYDFAKINPISQNYIVPANCTKLTNGKKDWVNSEFYFSGTIISLGGKSNSIIQLISKDPPVTLNIKANRDYLANISDNILYKVYGVRVSGKQDAYTDIIDFDSLSLIELVPYRDYTDSEVSEMVKKGTVTWKDVDADQWLKNIRGQMPLRKKKLKKVWTIKLIAVTLHRHSQ